MWRGCLLKRWGRGFVHQDTAESHSAASGRASEQKESTALRGNAIAVSKGDWVTDRNQAPVLMIPPVASEANTKGS